MSLPFSESTYGLPPALLEDIRRIFQNVPHLQWVKLYGSRAKGTHRPNSDIDLAFCVTGDDDISGRLWSRLDELPTPYQFDVTNYDLIENTEFRDHIDRVGIRLL